MDALYRISEDADYKWDDQTRDQRDLIVQSIISIGFGLAAFIAFCVRGDRGLGLEDTTDYVWYHSS